VNGELIVIENESPRLPAVCSGFQGNGLPDRQFQAKLAAGHAELKNDIEEKNISVV